jgi:hypothetical protein
MRDTPYAKEIKSAIIAFPDHSEGRIERLLIKDSQQEEIRFTWWKDGNLVPRPLDLLEEDLLTLFENAFQEKVFSEGFLVKLKQMFQ